MATLLSTAAELQALQRSDAALKVLDVRLAEDYKESHLPGALNQCVFEVVFLDGVTKLGLAKEDVICVYGASTESYESRVAAEKLERNGWVNVYDFRGGIDEWLRAGLPLEGTPAQPKGPVSDFPDGDYVLDVGESKVEWTGRNLINKHSGEVALSRGMVEFRNGVPQRGFAVLDLRHITCSDLAGNPLHDVLIHHLQSDDFFDVARFPEARFAFDRASVTSPRPGGANLRLQGELTLRGETHPLIIEAAAGLTPEGRGALQATLKLDRTEWGVIYGSGKFFYRLLGHLVNDEVEIQLRLLTVKAA